MPFGPVNGPVIFILFIHNMDSTWKELAMESGIVFDAATGTIIIVDDIFSWVPAFHDFIKYFIYQLDVCLSQNLSLSLKSAFLPGQNGVRWTQRWRRWQSARAKQTFTDQSMA